MSASQENTVWSGTPSQKGNLGHYSAMVFVAAALAMLLSQFGHGASVAKLLMPLAVATAAMFGAWLRTKCTQYTLTDQRLIMRRGVFSRTTDYVELYRVKDSHFTQSFFQRVLGIGTIRLRTTQDSAPLVVMADMNAPEALWNQIRGLVESRRDAKGVRELDMHSETGG